jgi:DNA topoisomerase-1
LVKKLEELGIGRPSTYAPTISTIQKRGYVEKLEREGTVRKYAVLELKDGSISHDSATETTGKEKNKLSPTDIGTIVTEFLSEHFSGIMDYHFTAKVEQEFDEIAKGLREWTDMIHTFYQPFHQNVENTLEHSERATGERELGIHPESGKKVIARMGRFGPMIQIGDEQTDGEKPLFASLRKEQSISNISLEQALDLFKLPRLLGEIDEQAVKVNNGRFGPYVQVGKLFVSIPKEEDLMAITLERATELYRTKLEEEANKLIKSFPEREDIQVLNGRWGPYIKAGKNNYKIPKTQEAADLTLEECLELIEKQSSAPQKGKRKPAKRA